MNQTKKSFSDELGKWTKEDGTTIRAVYRESMNGNGAIWVLSSEEGCLGWGCLEHAQDLVNKQFGKTVWGEPTAEEKKDQRIEDLEFALNVARNTLQGVVDGEFHNPRKMAQETIKVLDETL